MHAFKILMCSTLSKFDVAHVAASKGRRCTQDMQSPWFCVVHRTRTTPKRPWDFNISSLWFNIMNFIVLTTVVVALPFSLLRPVFYLANLFTRTSKKQM